MEIKVMGVCLMDANKKTRIPVLGNSGLLLLSTEDFLEVVQFITPTYLHNKLTNYIASAMMSCIRMYNLFLLKASANTKSIKKGALLSSTAKFL